MHQSHMDPGGLLTALEVQERLHIDRSTVYRMAEDGRLPAIRVGRSWRFPAARIEAMLAAGALRTEGTAPVPTAAPRLDEAAASAAVAVAADLLGVMMVVTDMHGRPITAVANPCTWFAEHGAEPGVVDRCVAEWHDLADHPDLTPRFQPGALGFECARAFVRHGTTLVGMVLAGGVSPSSDASVDPDLYHLDEEQRDRVLATLPRIAAAISTVSSRPAASSPTAPTGAQKEN